MELQSGQGHAVTALGLRNLVGGAARRRTAAVPHAPASLSMPQPSSLAPPTPTRASVRRRFTCTDAYASSHVSYAPRARPAFFQAVRAARPRLARDRGSPSRWPRVWHAPPAARPGRPAHPPGVSAQGVGASLASHSARGRPAVRGFAARFRDKGRGLKGRPAVRGLSREHGTATPAARPAPNKALC